MLTKAFATYIFLRGFLFPCHFDKKENGFVQEKRAWHIERLGTLPNQVNESSGLAMSAKNNLFTHNDSGGEPKIYEVDLEGQLLDSLDLSLLKNHDWETLAQDTLGNLFVGDIGNNANNRKNLEFHKISPDGVYLGAIAFTYPDQKRFPPSKDQLNFDCEGTFWHRGQLCLISKNRGNRWTKLYEVPDQPGHYTATLVDSIPLKGMITGADISPSGKVFFLLGYGHVYSFDVLAGKIDFSRPSSTLYVKRFAQSEAILAREQSTLIVTNEGGKIFQLTKQE